MDVTPDKQNLDTVFGSTTFYIDFYQRQYKWAEEPVNRLIEDIFYRFNIEHTKYLNNDIQLEKLIDQFSWYYLNTYVTNTIGGKRYVVDGQQRLTTLTLILIKLHHLAIRYHSKLKDWIDAKIAGQSGYTKKFWMNHENETEVLKTLLENDINIAGASFPPGITSDNMVKNYKVISNYLLSELNNEQKFERFVFYFLKRLVLINLNVEQTDVPMIFEVINDRGVKLKPYEILKGKLLGQIDKDELDALNLNQLWDKQVEKLNNFRDDATDDFFIYYLRSRFAESANDARHYDRDYHRTMFSSNINQSLKLLHNPKGVKNFLQNQYIYYSDLYSKIYDYYNKPHDNFLHIYYNRLNDMDMQFLLILSTCTLNDSEEAEKLRAISYNLDRLFCLLQIQRSYDSNEFNAALYQISSNIRDASVASIRPIFDKCLKKLLSEARGINVNDVFSYSLFKDTGIELNKRFIRYFFARVENFIASNTNINMKHSLYDLVANTGTVNGFHIEHILAMNSQNLKLFSNDQEIFERERNRLGGLLLLKGKDNISSNAEEYSQKLKTYANTLYWNESLRSDSYKSKLDFKNMKNKFKLSFRSMNKFGPNELEERHRLLFDIAKIIWA